MLSTGFPNAATPPGSTAYYVTRFSPQDKRDSIAMLFLWKHELDRLHAVNDPGVARIKLQWWLEQISLPLETPSEHPLASRLGRLYHASDKNRSMFKAMSQETDRLLHRQIYNDVTDLWQGCINHGGNFALLIQQVTEPKTNFNPISPGAWICLIERMQLLGQAVRQNIQILPMDLLKKHQLSFDQLLKTENQDKVSKMLFDLTEQLQCIEQIQSPGKADTPLKKYYKLRFKLYQLLKDENFAVIQQRISLTPVRKLWFAL